MAEVYSDGAAYDRYMYKSTHHLTVGWSVLIVSYYFTSTHAASIFSLANGTVSVKVCIGVLP